MKRLILHLFAYLFLLALVACQKGRVQSQLFAEPAYQTPFERTGQKVRLNKSELQWVALNSEVAVPGLSQVFQSPVGLDSVLLAPGTALSVLVDEECLSHKRDRGDHLVVLGQKLSFSGVPVGVQTHKVSFSEPTAFSEIVRQAKDDACVKGVSHHRVAMLESVADDPMVIQQTHLAAMKLFASYASFFDPQKGIQKDVVIAVVDSGIDLTHKDLKENLWVNTAELNGVTGVDDDQDGYVDDIYGYNFDSQFGDPTHQVMVNDHGTHVSGLAAAISENGEGGMGVMGRKVKIMALNVTGKHMGADTESIDRAIRFAADHGAHVINLSVGSEGTSDTTAAAMAYALKKGSLVVASAGNSKLDIQKQFYFPASYAAQYPGLLSVAATDVRTGGLCDFSNFSSRSVKVAAPGCDREAQGQGLLSTRMNSRYGYRKGTSQSAPLISGALALTVGLIRDRTGKAPSPAEVERVFLGGSESNQELLNWVADGKALSIDSLHHVIDHLYSK